MGILEQYDPTQEALINPGEFVYRDAISNQTDFLSYMDDFPAVAVSAFSGAIVDKMVRTCHAAEVAATAEVRLNGQVAGIRVAPPWRVDISKQAKPGENRIEVLVFNTLANLRVLIALDPPQAQAMLDLATGGITELLAIQRRIIDEDLVSYGF